MAKIKTRVTLRTPQAVAMIKAANNAALTDMGNQALPWKKFLYLFNGLPADTKIKQIMRIRQMPVPEYNGKNSKEIQEINEMKSYYALPVEGGGGQSGLDLLFHTLEGMAKR